jgi:hypothetical protein
MKYGPGRLIKGGMNKKKTKKTVPKKTEKTVSKKIEKTVSKKTKKDTKKSTKKGIKKDIKKEMNKKKIKSSQKGGSNGSDFALTLNSRGPANAPNDYWGVNGETWFRQFNKTGDYIPNSQLKYAAAPISTGYGQPMNNTVSGYDQMDMAFI